MRLLSSITQWAAVAPLLLGGGQARLVGIPTEPFEEDGQGSYSLDQLNSIIVDDRFADTVDNDGLTLIPPTLEEFVETFSDDLASSLGLDVPITSGTKAEKDSVFVTIGEANDYKDVAGRNTSEGYSLEVSSEGITITGASPLGAWWATRTIVQQALLGGSKLPHGSGSNAPGWGSRGFMLDAGRHWYPPEFLIEMCSWLSFWKQNTFHVHMSDNVIFDPSEYSTDRSDGQYAAFRPWSDEPALEGLNIRPNESYYRSDLENIQQKCASRGVTIVPEIEAPGHSLVFSQWKPELGLDTDKSLLNITQPDVIPTMETVWETFLPWFHSKSVHIGADEYDRALVKDYTYFVNAMNDYIKSESSKEMRVWGTFPPSPDGENIGKDVVIQHWYSGMANPYFDYIKNGYKKIINTDQSFYVVPAKQGHPQHLSLDLVFSGNPDGGPFSPNILDPSNATNNPPLDEPSILGHIAALWNDPGHNATTISEPFYAYGEGLAALGDKQWGGDLELDEFNTIFSKLRDIVPAQNLARNIESESDTILEYLFQGNSSNNVTDSSGNGYDGTSHGCSITSSEIKFSNGCFLETPLSSKGRNYTLSFSVKQTSEQQGTLFSGKDSILYSGHDDTNKIMLVECGNQFPVDYSLPLDEWVDIRLIGKDDATFLEITEGGQTTRKEFLAEIGLSADEGPRKEPVGIEAPLAKIGEGFEGSMKNVTLFGSA